MIDILTKSNKPVMFSTSWCSDCMRAKYILDEYGVDYVDIDVDQDQAGLAFVKDVNGGRRIVPTIVFPDKTILVEPTNQMLVEKLGIDL
jgi:mycoredoxin